LNGLSSRLGWRDGSPGVHHDLPDLPGTCTPTFFGTHRVQEALIEIKELQRGVANNVQHSAGPLSESVPYFKE
jgi:hypothetical protein